MNLLLWTDHLHDGMLPVLEQLKKIGYDGVEVPIFSPDEKLYRRLGQAARRPRPRAHRRHDPHRGRQPDLARRQSPRRRRRSHQAHARLLPRARRRIAVRPVPLRPRPLQRRGPDARTNGSGASTACAPSPSTRQAPASCSPSNTSTASRPTSSPAPPTRPASSREVNHPSCRMMYDTFHANIEEKNIADAIRTAAPYTVHVHISENDRSTPGAGPRRAGRKPSTRSTKSATTAGWSSKPSASRCRRSPPPPKSGGDVRERRATRPRCAQVHEGGNRRDRG